MNGTKNRRRRKGFTLIELMIVIAIIGVLAAIAVPNFRAARERANQRACYANQKTIAGAVEMYNLDFNTSITALSDTVFQDLKTNGYLQSIPNDPGYGNASVANYSMTSASGDGITCSVHGPIREPTTTGS